MYQIKCKYTVPRLSDEEANMIKASIRGSKNITARGSDIHFIHQLDRPHHFTYVFNAGPLPLEELTQANFTVGNCRRAIQDYLYCIHGLYLTPDQVLLPEGFVHTGEFITRDEFVDWALYQPGDIIYAERIQDKEHRAIDRSRTTYDSDEAWMVQLHSAIYMGSDTVYHATAITGETCFWSIPKFLEYYKIIAVKRVL